MVALFGTHWIFFAEARAEENEESQDLYDGQIGVGSGLSEYCTYRDEQRKTTTVVYTFEDLFCALAFTLQWGMRA